MKLPFDFEKTKQWVIDTPVWRSMFRGGVWKDTPRDRAQHVIGNVWLHVHPSRIRKHWLNLRYTWGLGILSFFLFLVLTVTGVLLMMYYRPATELAYRDMKDLEFAVSLGMFLRNMHRWSAHAMVLITILHMVRVFMTGSYKTPREFNWGVGVILLTLTLFLSFTGYLLPWDQLALWAINVGANMAAATPVIGADGPFSMVGLKNDARFILLGGTSVGENTLIRFYVMHCVLVPLIAGILMIVHFWRVRKDDFSGPPIAPEKLPADKIDVWPHLIIREYAVGIICLIVLIVWSLAINAPLEEMANPTVTPNPSKAPWYFLGLQELLVYFDPWIAGVFLPGVIIGGLVAMPYLEKDKDRGVGSYAWRERPFAYSGFMFGIVFWFVLIFVGTFMRGPSWSLYMPWEDWAIHKPPPPSTFSLSNWLGGPLLLLYFGAGPLIPKLVTLTNSTRLIVAKIAMGTLVLLLGLAVITPLTFAQSFWVGASLFVYLVLGVVLPSRYIKTLDFVRYAITMTLLLMMIGVFLKIGLRWGFNVKYIFSLPAFSFNI